MGDFETPVPRPGEELISVRASALSHFSKSRAAGSHYSAGSAFPAIAGSDGVGITQDGRRVYFVLPDAPFGALAELCPVRSSQCIELPDALDEITAAAIANPGMSAVGLRSWSALISLPAKPFWSTALPEPPAGLPFNWQSTWAQARSLPQAAIWKRWKSEKKLGADIAIPFLLGSQHPSGAKEYEEALKQVFASGIDIVIDYLWGESAKTIIVAIAKSVEDSTPVRFVHVGRSRERGHHRSARSRASLIGNPAHGERSEKRAYGPSCCRRSRASFETVHPAGLKIATTVLPLSKVEEVWDKAAGKPRVVFSIG